jgi:hypothetical protein
MRFGQVPSQILTVPILAVLLLAGLAVDSQLSRVDGVMLLSGFVLALAYLARLGRRGLDIRPAGEVAETLRNTGVTPPFLRSMRTAHERLSRFEGVRRPVGRKPPRPRLLAWGADRQNQPPKASAQGRRRGRSNTTYMFCHEAPALSSEGGGDAMTARDR